MAYGMKVTAVGAAKIADAALNGGEVVFSKVLWGDASGTAYNPTGSETALVNQRHETDVQQVILVPGQPNVIQVDGLITNAPAGFTILEVGIEDEDGDLIAIGRHPPQQIPSSSDTWQANYEPSFLLAVSNTGVVTVNITPENDFLTKVEADTYYDPLGSGVQAVLEGIAIDITGTGSHPVVNVDLGALDARYRGINSPFPLQSHRHDNATQSEDGFMSAADKTKLDGVNILGGTAFFNKVAEARITSPSAYADILNIPTSLSRVLIIAQGLRLATMPSTPGSGRTVTEIRMQTGNGASLYTGANDYGSAKDHIVLSDTVDDGIWPYGGIIRDSTGVLIRSNLFFIVQGLGSASRHTRILGHDTSFEGGIANQLLAAPEDFDAAWAAPAAGFGRAAATAENRIRIWVPSNNWIAGRFMAFAVGA